MDNVVRNDSASPRPVIFPPVQVSPATSTTSSASTESKPRRKYTRRAPLPGPQVALDLSGPSMPTEAASRPSLPTKAKRQYRRRAQVPYNRPDPPPPARLDPPPPTPCPMLGTYLSPNPPPPVPPPPPARLDPPPPAPCPMLGTYLSPNPPPPAPLLTLRPCWRPGLPPPVPCPILRPCWPPNLPPPAQLPMLWPCWPPDPQAMGPSSDAYTALHLMGATAAVEHAPPPAKKARGRPPTVQVQPMPPMSEVGLSSSSALLSGHFLHPVTSAVRQAALLGGQFGTEVERQPPVAEGAFQTSHGGSSTMSIPPLESESTPLSQLMRLAARAPDVSGMRNQYLREVLEETSHSNPPEAGSGGSSFVDKAPSPALSSQVTVANSALEESQSESSSAQLSGNCTDEPVLDPGIAKQAAAGAVTGPLKLKLDSTCPEIVEASSEVSRGVTVDQQSMAHPTESNEGTDSESEDVNSNEAFAKLSGNCTDEPGLDPGIAEQAAAGAVTRPLNMALDSTCPTIVKASSEVSREVTADQQSLGHPTESDDDTDSESEDVNIDEAFAEASRIVARKVVKELEEHRSGESRLPKKTERSRKPGELTTSEDPCDELFDWFLSIPGSEHGAALIFGLLKIARVLFPKRGNGTLQVYYLNMWGLFRQKFPDSPTWDFFVVWLQVLAECFDLPRPSSKTLKFVCRDSGASSTGKSYKEIPLCLLGSPDPSKAQEPLSYKGSRASRKRTKPACYPGRHEDHVKTHQLMVTDHNAVAVHKRLEPLGSLNASAPHDSLVITDNPVKVTESSAEQTVSALKAADANGTILSSKGRQDKSHRNDELQTVDAERVTCTREDAAAPALSQDEQGSSCSTDLLPVLHSKTVSEHNGAQCPSSTPVLLSLLQATTAIKTQLMETSMTSDIANCSTESDTGSAASGDLGEHEVGPSSHEPTVPKAQFQCSIPARFLRVPKKRTRTRFVDIYGNEELARIGLDEPLASADLPSASNATSLNPLDIAVCTPDRRTVSSRNRCPSMLEAYRKRKQASRQEITTEECDSEKPNALSNCSFNVLLGGECQEEAASLQQPQKNICHPATKTVVEVEKKSELQEALQLPSGKKNGEEEGTSQPLEQTDVVQACSSGMSEVFESKDTSDSQIELHQNLVNASELAGSSLEEDGSQKILEGNPPSVSHDTGNPSDAVTEQSNAAGTEDLSSELQSSDLVSSPAQLEEWDMKRSKAPSGDVLHGSPNDDSGEDSMGCSEDLDEAAFENEELVAAGGEPSHGNVSRGISVTPVESMSTMLPTCDERKVLNDPEAELVVGPLEVTHCPAAGAADLVQSAEEARQKHACSVAVDGGKGESCEELLMPAPVHSNVQLSVQEKREAKDASDNPSEVALKVEGPTASLQEWQITGLLDVEVSNPPEVDCVPESVDTAIEAVQAVPQLPASEEAIEGGAAFSEDHPHQRDEIAHVLEKQLPAGQDSLDDDAVQSSIDEGHQLPVPSEVNCLIEEPPMDYGGASLKYENLSEGSNLTGESTPGELVLNAYVSSCASLPPVAQASYHGQDIFWAPTDGNGSQEDLKTESDLVLGSEEILNSSTESSPRIPLPGNDLPDLGGELHLLDADDVEEIDLERDVSLDAADNLPYLGEAKMGLHKSSSSHLDLSPHPFQSLADDNTTDELTFAVDHDEEALGDKGIIDGKDSPVLAEDAAEILPGEENLQEGMALAQQWALLEPDDPEISRKAAADGLLLLGTRPCSFVGGRRLSSKNAAKHSGKPVARAGKPMDLLSQQMPKYPPRRIRRYIKGMFEREVRIMPKRASAVKKINYALTNTRKKGLRQVCPPSRVNRQKKRILEEAEAVEQSSSQHSVEKDTTNEDGAEPAVEPDGESPPSEGSVEPPLENQTSSESTPWACSNFGWKDPGKTKQWFKDLLGCHDWDKKLTSSQQKFLKKFEAETHTIDEWRFLAVLQYVDLVGTCTEFNKFCRSLESTQNMTRTSLKNLWSWYQMRFASLNSMKLLKVPQKMLRNWGLQCLFRKKIQAKKAKKRFMCPLEAWKVIKEVSSLDERQPDESSKQGRKKSKKGRLASDVEKEKNVKVPDQPVSPLDKPKKPARGRAAKRGATQKLGEIGAKRKKSALEDEVQAVNTRTRSGKAVTSQVTQNSETADEENIQEPDQPANKNQHGQVEPKAALPLNSDETVEQAMKKELDGLPLSPSVPAHAATNTQQIRAAKLVEIMGTGDIVTICRVRSSTVARAVPINPASSLPPATDGLECSNIYNGVSPQSHLSRMMEKSIVCVRSEADLMEVARSLRENAVPRVLSDRSRGMRGGKKPSKPAADKGGYTNEGMVSFNQVMDLYFTMNKEGRAAYCSDDRKFSLVNDGLKPEYVEDPKASQEPVVAGPVSEKEVCSDALDQITV